MYQAYQPGYQQPGYGYQPPAPQPPPAQPATTTVNAPPITNPKIPFIGSLPPMHDGLMIYMVGYVPAGAQGFHVNLSMGGGYNGTVESALHLAVRQPTQEIARNSYLAGYWGAEESGGPGFPFLQGQGFNMHIAVTDEAYKVAVNGRHFCGFRHRVQKERVTHLVIEGGVVLQSIQYQGQRPNPAAQRQSGYGYAPPQSYAPPPPAQPVYQPPPPQPVYQPPPPQPAPVAPPPQAATAPPPAEAPPPYAPATETKAPPTGLMALAPKVVKEEEKVKDDDDEPDDTSNMQPTEQEGDNLPNPYVVSLSGMKVGQEIEIGGTPHKNAESFVLEWGFKHSKKKDIPFHMRVGFPIQSAVRNAMSGGKYGKPEKEQPHFPFKEGQKFAMRVDIKEDAYQISVNDNMFCVFKHREKKLSKVRYLEVSGDLNISSVKVKG